MTWSVAQSYCRQYHTDLAIVRNVTENSAILAIITAWSWIGLVRDNLNWVDPNNVSPVPFSSGEPNAAGVAGCGYFYKGLAGDRICSDLSYFYCYSGTLHLYYYFICS